MANVLLHSVLCGNCGALMNLDKRGHPGKAEWTLVCPNLQCSNHNKEFRVPKFPVEEI